jgi:hypothetical protein
MNALTTIGFASAYRQLRPAEKVYVDAYVADAERTADRNNERISLALNRPIPAKVIEQSRGMLDIPLVRAAIAERINDIAASSELTVQRIIKELMAMAFSSMGDYMTVGEDGKPYFDLARCTPEELSAIKSIEYETTGGDGISRATRNKLKIALYDKQGAIDMLGKYMGIFERDNVHWRNDQPRPVGQQLPGNATVDDAQNRYAQMING